MQQLSKQFELVAISSHFFTDIYTFNITNAVNCSMSIDFIWCQHQSLFFLSYFRVPPLHRIKAHGLPHIQLSLQLHP